MDYGRHNAALGFAVRKIITGLIEIITGLIEIITGLIEIITEIIQIITEIIFSVPNPRNFLMFCLANSIVSLLF